MSKKPIEPAQDAETVARIEDDSDLEKLLVAARAAADRKALDLVALDIRKIASFADFFLICSGNSSRQVQAISDEVSERLRGERGSRPLHVEGYEAGEWVLMDYGDVIVHVFVDESRKFYQLERLWRDAERVELPADL
jgi:ribosome-associated protein